MRILHTADWHLGKTLEGRDRQNEQEKFVEEICGICREENIQLVLITGDVFQSPNPSAAAEELFYHALEQLADNGRRAVVAIAGNHDNPERLCAASPLAQRLGITLAGLPTDSHAAWEFSGAGGDGRVRRISGGPAWLELAVPGCDHCAVIIALPYPSEGRLRRLLATTLEDRDLRQGYGRAVADLLGDLAAQHFRPGTVNLIASHLFVAGGQEVDRELEANIQVGGAYAVPPEAFPASAQYVALGHLHRPQQIASPAASPCIRYAGSPLAYSFAEIGHTKSVVVADILPGKPAAVREIPLAAPNPLVRWQAKAGLAEVWSWIDSGRDANAWIDLEIFTPELLTAEDIRRLREARPRLVNIRPVVVTSGNALPKTAARLADLKLDELFIRFYSQVHGGLSPDPELVRLFLELTGESDAAAAAGEEEISE